MDFMHSDISTARLLLRPVKPIEEDPIALERFNTLWSSEQATRWSQRGPCKTLEESKAWMEGIIPIPMPTNRIRVSYFVLYIHGDEGLIHPTKMDETHWRMAGVVTLLATNFTLEGEVDNCERGFDEPCKAVELGYLFMPEVWGKGFATESVRAVLDVYRQDIETTNSLFPHEIQANAHDKNAASRRVLEKTGFKEVGRFESETYLPLAGSVQNSTIVHFRWSNDC